jgi:hypothetical protein
MRDLALAVWVLTFAACGVRWEKADRFRESLHCGLTVDQVRRIAIANDVEANLPSSDTDPNVKNLIVGRGRRVFRLGFEGGHLVSVQPGHYTGVDGLNLGTRVDLCKAPLTTSSVMR